MKNKHVLPEYIFLFTVMLILGLFAAFHYKNKQSMFLPFVICFILLANLVIMRFFWRKSGIAAAFLKFCYFVWDRKEKDLILLKKEDESAFDEKCVREARGVCFFFTCASMVLLLLTSQSL